MEVLLDYIFTAQTFLLIFVLVLIKQSVKFVPQNRAFIIERFGKYTRTLEAGLNFIRKKKDKYSGCSNSITSLVIILTIILIIENQSLYINRNITHEIFHTDTFVHSVNPFEFIEKLKF